MLRRFNIWFDSLPNGRRAFLFLMIMFGWIIPMSPPNDGSTHVLSLFIVGMIWLILAGAFGLYRLLDSE